MSPSPRNRLLFAVFVLAVVASLPALSLYAQERAQATSNPPYQPPYLPGVAIFATILALCHVFAPQIRRVLEKKEEFVGSFGGGMAIGYVFVHLLPELEAGHPFLGKAIFLMALAGFVIFYGVHELSYVRSGGESQRVAPLSGFYLKLIPLWVFNWLIVYALPVHYLQSGVRVVPIGLALLLHLIHKDYLLVREYPRPFGTWGRFVLALAPLAGWVTALVARSNQEAINDILVALLAGTVLYSVFREELPEHVSSRFPSFIAGVIVFLIVVLIAGLT